MERRSARRFGLSFGISAGIHLAVFGLFLFFSSGTGFRDESVIHVALVGPAGEAASPAGIRQRPWTASRRPAAPDRSAPAGLEGQEQEITGAIERDPADPGQASQESTPSPSIPSADGTDRAGSIQTGLLEPAGLGTAGLADGMHGTIKPDKNDLAFFLKEVKSRIERAKRYPWLARLHGQEGTVRVEFVIHPEGDVGEVHLLESSRWPVLDEEAMATVRRAGQFSDLPSAWAKGIKVVVPLMFKLRTSEE